ncbi:unnamed protein product [Ectocarpus fasciculatus]
MAKIRWGPWSGASRKSHRTPARNSAWSLDDDLVGLQQTMLSMLTDPALSDVCLVVEGIDVPCHKAVLAAWSRPFRAMFTLPMLESRHQCRVVIEDAEHKHLMVVLDYLYSGRIGFNDQNVMPVSALANRYEVLPLMAQCEGYMKWRLHPSNVVAHLLSAEEHRVPKAAAFALEYLAVHFDEVHHDSSSGDFNSLGGDTVLRVLQHDGLTVDEETVFLAVDGWAKAWEHRRSIRGATRNYAVGRSPPPAVAEQGTQALGVGSTSNRVSSSSHSVKKTLSATDFPPSTAVPERVQHTDETDEQGGGGGGSVVKDASSSASSEKNPRNLKGRERPGLGAGFTLRGTTAEGTSPQSQSRVGVGRTRETDSQGSGSGSSIGSSISSSSSSSRSGSSSSASGAPPPSLSPSLGMAATTAALVSFPTAAGAAAAARRLTGEEQALTRRPSSSTTPTSNVAATAASHTTMRDTRSDAAPGPPGWRGRECNGGAGEERSTTGVGDEPPKGVAEGVAGRVLQRRASGPAGGEGKQGGYAGEVEVLQRAASFSHPPPPPETPVAGVRKAAAVGAPESSSPIEGMTGEGKGALETMVPIPEEEQAFVDELLMEVRFPLVSTSFLCQVVEKSPVITGSRVAQRLLHEAYRFQAIRPDGVDVDELFPGNHRVKYRGHERVLFGEDEGCVGHVEDYSSSLSEVHLVENVKQRDEKYWLPGQPEEAYFCVRLDRVRRITKFRLQNRYSEEFEVAVRRTRREEWQVIVPRQTSGGHKDVKSLDLTRKRVKARHVKISLRGRKRSCYNTSCYWVELLGF